MKRSVKMQVVFQYIQLVVRMKKRKQRNLKKCVTIGTMFLQTINNHLPQVELQVAVTPHLFRTTLDILLYRKILVKVNYSRENPRKFIIKVKNIGKILIPSRVFSRKNESQKPSHDACRYQNCTLFEQKLYSFYNFLI